MLIPNQVAPKMKTVQLKGPNGQNNTVLFVRSNRVTEPKVHFAGENTAKRTPLVLGTLVASLLAATGLKAQEPGNQPPAQPPRAVVNSAKDMPQLEGFKGPILTLQQNSVISPAAQKQLTDLINELNRSGHGQLAVVEIPDTSRADLNDLATEIFNTLKLGQEGKNDGVLLLVNNAGLKQGVRGKQMFIKPGHGIKDKITADMATKLLIDHAVPHLKEGQKTGNFDKAILSTVEGIKQFMETDVPNHNNFKDNFKLTQNQKIAIAVVAILLLVLLLVLLVKSGACKGGSSSGGSGDGCSGNNIIIFGDPCSGGGSSGGCDGVDPKACDGIGDAIGGGFSSGGGGGI